jgi:hypothetical protein
MEQNSEKLSKQGASNGIARSAHRSTNMSTITGSLMDCHSLVNGGISSHLPQLLVMKNGAGIKHHLPIGVEIKTNYWQGLGGNTQKTTAIHVSMFTYPKLIRTGVYTFMGCSVVHFKPVGLKIMRGLVVLDIWLNQSRSKAYYKQLTIAQSTSKNKWGSRRLRKALEELTIHGGSPLRRELAQAWIGASSKIPKQSSMQFLKDSSLLDMT